MLAKIWNNYKYHLKICENKTTFMEADFLRINSMLGWFSRFGLILHKNKDQE